MTSTVTDFLQMASNISGLVILLGLLFPKIGEALLGHLLSGSLERQKAGYIRQLETHKSQLSIELENIKKINTEEIEQFKLMLIQKAAHASQFRDFQQTRQLAIREQLIAFIEKDEIDTDINYGLAKKICASIFVNKGVLPTEICDIADRLDLYIEAPLSLTESTFTSEVREICTELVNSLDRNANFQIGAKT